MIKIKDLAKKKTAPEGPFSDILMQNLNHWVRDSQMLEDKTRIRDYNINANFASLRCCLLKGTSEKRLLSAVCDSKGVFQI